LQNSGFWNGPISLFLFRQNSVWSCGDWNYTSCLYFVVILIIIQYGIWYDRINMLISK
jgi:hypothetical protein